MRVTAAIDAGTVWCNQYALLHTGAPFGGFKMSGVGRELGTYGLEAYMQVSNLHRERLDCADAPPDQGRPPQLGQHNGVADLDDLTTLYLTVVNAAIATNWMEYCRTQIHYRVLSNPFTK